VGWIRAVLTQWGSSTGERAAAYPCDDLLADPDVTAFRALDVDAPPATVFRWLAQLQVAPYSYDWLDNLGRRSPRQLTDGLDELELGQRFMSIFRLARLEPGRSITLTNNTALFGRIAVTYRVVERDAEHSRLIVKLLASAGSGLIPRVLMPLLPAGDLVMMRRQLLNLKRLAERTGERSTS
jgi:hypothetical protein